jgi:hypothetical protein
MERFATHITGKWPLPTMYQLVCLQNMLISESLITNIAGKWTLPTVNVLMIL